MKYTKAQRHRIYKNGLSRVGHEIWLCWVLAPIDSNELADLKDSPEVWEQKPKHLFTVKGYGWKYWFNTDDKGKNKRRAILRKAIRQTAPKKKILKP